MFFYVLLQVELYYELCFVATLVGGSLVLPNLRSLWTKEQVLLPGLQRAVEEVLTEGLHLLKGLRLSKGLTRERPPAEHERRSAWSILYTSLFLNVMKFNHGKEKELLPSSWGAVLEAFKLIPRE